MYGRRNRGAAVGTRLSKKLSTVYALFPKIKHYILLLDISPETANPWCALKGEAARKQMPPQNLGSRPDVICILFRPEELNSLSLNPGCMTPGDTNSQMQS